MDAAPETGDSRPTRRESLWVERERRATRKLPGGASELPHWYATERANALLPWIPVAAMMLLAVYFTGLSFHCKTQPAESSSSASRVVAGVTMPNSLLAGTAKQPYGAIDMRALVAQTGVPALVGAYAMDPDGEAGRGYFVPGNLVVPLTLTDQDERANAMVVFTEKGEDGLQACAVRSSTSPPGESDALLEDRAWDMPVAPYGYVRLRHVVLSDSYVGCVTVARDIQADAQSTWAANNDARAR